MQSISAEYIALGIFFLIFTEGIPLTISAIVAFQRRYPSSPDIQCNCLFLLNKILLYDIILLSSQQLNALLFFVFIVTLPGTFKWDAWNTEWRKHLTTHVYLQTEFHATSNKLSSNYLLFTLLKILPHSLLILGIWHISYMKGRCAAKSI